MLTRLALAIPDTVFALSWVVLLSLSGLWGVYRLYRMQAIWSPSKEESS